MLAKNGANLNYKDANGWTPLIGAVFKREKLEFMDESLSLRMTRNNESGKIPINNHFHFRLLLCS